MPRLSGQSLEDSGSEVNLTPMLDVVFIMLIFFIVTATFVKESGIVVNQPDSDQPPTLDPNKQSIVVKVSSRDIITLGHREIDIRSVRANIARLHAQDPEAGVVILPHEKSSTKVIIGIMDAARQANIYNVQLGAVTKKPSPY